MFIICFKYLKRQFRVVQLLPLLFLFAGCNTVKDQPASTFRIITYNVWVGYRDGAHPRLPCYDSGEKRKEGIYRWLQQQDPDVVVYQELIGYTDEQLQKEARALGHPYALIHKDKGMAMGISSKYPIEIYEILGEEAMHHGLLYGRTGGVDILATHLWPSFDETILDEVNKVIKRARESMASQRPLLLLGDLNAFSPQDDPYVSEETMYLYVNQWKWGLENGRPSYRVIQALLDTGLQDVCLKFPKNDPARAQRYDYIFASPELADKCTDAIHFQEDSLLLLSDHFPVMAAFNWAVPEEGKE
jgi:endonuclease/exonuclease/phosphatase family metal-dependent hydrolase